MIPLEPLGQPGSNTGPWLVPLAGTWGPREVGALLWRKQMWSARRAEKPECILLAVYPKEDSGKTVAGAGVGLAQGSPGRSCLCDGQWWR